MERPYSKGRLRCGRPRSRSAGSVYNFGVDPRLRHTFEVQHNVLGDECAQTLKAFFAGLRDS